MKPNEIKKNRESISNSIQGLWKELSKIEMALINVENTINKDYSYLDDEEMPHPKDYYINRAIAGAKKMADMEIKDAIVGILRKSNEITNKALEMIEEEIEF